MTHAAKGKEDSKEAAQAAAKPKGKRGRVVISKDKCKGCKWCVEHCPKGVLETGAEFNAKAYHYPRVKAGMEDACIACGMCELICPDFAIYVVEEGGKNDA